MSIQAINWALRQEVKPSARKFVLVCLANYADADAMCFPGQASIARDTGQSERSVRAHLSALESGGLITRSHRQRLDGSRTSDIYELILAADSSSSCDANRQRSPNQPARSARPIEPSEEEPSVIAPLDIPPLALQMWNEIIETRCRLTQSRKRRLKSVVDELGGLDNWRDYCCRIRGSPFLSGENPRSWRASLDWSLKELNILKVLEGNFDDGRNNRTSDRRRAILAGLDIDLATGLSSASRDEVVDPAAIEDA